jgi:beta-glucanase (GH16 family)
LPASLAPGTYKILASVRNDVWQWQHVTQTPASFTIAAPVVHMPLYGTSSKFPTLLKPAGAGDALAGVGFLPDDGVAYTLIPGASDEFDGAALDTAKWWRRYHDYNGTLDHYNSELQRYIDNHIVSNGTLKLTAHMRATTFTAPTGKVYPMYDSSMIRSRTTFKYGYVEARVKLPPGLGVWPALWILPDAKWQAEIDFMEYVRNDATELADMVHCAVHENYGGGPYVTWLEKNSNSQWGYWKAPATLSRTYFIDDWHVFSCLWEPGLVTFYIDGYPVCQRHCGWLFVDGTDSGLASVLADLAMGDAWATANWTTNVATDDQVFEIDYVRVFQKADAIQIGTSPL